MSILDDASAWGHWALDIHTARNLAAHLDRARPRVIVECGSGSSTVLFAEYAHRTGATVLSLEHSPVHKALTEQRLRTDGLYDHARVVQADIGNVDIPGDRRPWYRTELPGTIDFALVDGPPGIIGREAAMFQLYPHLVGDWRVWLDDSTRDGESAAVKLWNDRYPLYHQFVPTPKGLTIFRSGIPDPRHVPDLSPVDASDLAITIITGRRPDELAATLVSLEMTTPGLLDSAFVAVLHNGADPETADVLDGCTFIDHRTVTTELLPVPVAAHAMLGSPPPRPYVLHLEDDWVACNTHTDWYPRARAVLEDDPQTGQVRLRHRGDTVQTRHAVTRRPIVWTPGDHGHLTGNGHYTLNPSLMRSADVPQIWDNPDSELGAQIRYTGTGWNVAQADPGVFRHIGGGGRSLRRRAGGRHRS